MACFSTHLSTKYRNERDGCFGSQADLTSHSSLVSASGRKADPRPGWMSGLADSGHPTKQDQAEIEVS